MRFVLLISLVFAAIFSFSQKTAGTFMPPQYKSSTATASFTKIRINGPNNSEGIARMLLSLIPTLGDQHCTIKLNYMRESVGGFHYSFSQLFAGVPVYQSEIKVNTDKSSTIHSIFDNSVDTRTWKLDIHDVDSNSVIAIDAQTGLPVLAERIIVNHNEVLMVKGQIMFQEDLNSYFQPTGDTVGRGQVFIPDPLTSSEEDTGGLYISHGDTDAPWLDAQEKVQEFVCDFDSGKYILRSPFVLLTNFGTDTPDVPPATSTNGLFYFNRSQPGFQDVNAFYHISTYHNYVHSLGFNCADSLVYIDTHAMLADNSYFTYGGYPYPWQIWYGIGGVPDAEDADVVVHEYCHFLSYTAAPGSNVGDERRALDEGFCDYNAASYSKSINTFHDYWVYNWDGHNQYWPGRVVNSTKIYPNDLDGSIYDNGEIWSSALFSLNGDIGRGPTDSLIIQTHYSYAQNLTMAQAAQLLIDADTLLYNGKYYCYIYNRLLEHGFVSADSNGCPAFPSGTMGPPEDVYSFLQHGDAFTLLNSGGTKVVIQILNIAGQEVGQPITISDGVYNYQNPQLSAGLYLVNIIAANSVNTFKWVNTGH